MKYNFEFFTANEDFQESSVGLIIHLLKESVLNITKCGPVEPCKTDFNEKNSNLIFKYFSGRIILTGHTKDVKVEALCGFDWFTGITRWGFTIESKKILNRDYFDNILFLLKSLQSQIPIIYGLISSFNEYDCLHKETIHFEGGGSSEGYNGVSNQDFTEFLPGVYWFNFYGEALTLAFGAKNIKTVPNVIYADIDKAVTAFYLPGNADIDNFDDRLAEIRKVRQYIGEEYFYDFVNVDKIKFSHPLRFKKFLTNVQQKFLQRHNRL